MIDNPEPQCLFPEIMIQLGIVVGHVLLPELDNHKQSRWNILQETEKQFYCYYYHGGGGLSVSCIWVYRAWPLALLLFM